MVDEELRKIADPIHVQFKPWRGSIYKRFIDPDTRWWAWVDSDIVLGDFKALWPWIVVDNFDVVTISEWDYGNIYLRVCQVARESVTTLMPVSGSIYSLPIQR